MKAIWKGLIIGDVLVAIGAGILITTLAINGWSLKATYTMQTFTAENDDNAIKLDIGASALKTEFYDGERIEISYPESNRFTTDITEKDGKLTFKSKLKWFARVSREIPETVIKLPKEKVFELEIDLGAGTVKLASGVYGKVEIDVSAGTLDAADISCRSLLCDVSAGTVNLSKVDCSSLVCDLSAGKIDINSITCPEIKADVSAGKLSLGVNGVKSEYTIKASVSAGSCNVSNQTGSTDKKLSVDCSAGSVTVNFIDSNQ